LQKPNNRQGLPGSSQVIDDGVLWKHIIHTTKRRGLYAYLRGSNQEKRLFFLLHNINTIETQAQSAIEREMLRCNLLAISTCGIHTAQLAQFSVVFIAMPHQWRWSDEIY
jgi:hypothetical protein